MIKNNAPQAVTSFVAWLSGDLVLRRLRWLISAVSVVVMALVASPVLLSPQSAAGLAPAGGW